MFSDTAKRGVAKNPDCDMYRNRDELFYFLENVITRFFLQFFLLSTFLDAFFY